MQLTKKGRRKRIHQRIRQKIQGTAARPRLTVYRSNNAIYCQLVADLNGHTLASASPITLDSGTKIEQAANVGKMIAEKAKAASIDTVVFDRSGYIYHGRVKALADGAREGGLAF